MLKTRQLRRTKWWAYATIKRAKRAMKKITKTLLAVIISPNAAINARNKIHRRLTPIDRDEICYGTYRPKDNGNTLIRNFLIPEITFLCTIGDSSSSDKFKASKVRSNFIDLT